MEPVISIAALMVIVYGLWRYAQYLDHKEN